jgi:hypothetical protein
MKRTCSIKAAGTKPDYAATLAAFLTERKGSCLKTWGGYLTANEQRTLFGQFLGKGKLWIDGTAETIEHHRKICFGTDTECTISLKWSAL